MTLHIELYDVHVVQSKKQDLKNREFSLPFDEAARTGKALAEEPLIRSMNDHRGENLVPSWIRNKVF